MLGISLRYSLKHPITAAKDLFGDPIQTWMTAHDSFIAERERNSRPPCQYQSEAAWERQLHTTLGLPFPCPHAAEFWSVWATVIRELEAKGIRPGPESFMVWNDGDAAFVRAIWCLIRHTRPKKIVETGVAHGVTSRCILEALQRNGEGHLWSIDLQPTDRRWRQQVGAAIGNFPQDRWSYIQGSSRRRLPQLLASLGEIDLFIHDSLHSERNVRFELDRAWAVLAPAGAVVVDDIDANYGFHSFTKAWPTHPSTIAEAEPLHPDLRRFNQKGLFGIILKQA